MIEDTIFVRPCKICGKPIEYTYRTKGTQYCSECKKEAERNAYREAEERRKARAYIERHAEAIAHQQDRTIWTSDYAERQKSRTLAMLGKIET